jgi:hypothetical protein
MKPRVKKWIRSGYTGELVPLYEKHPYHLYPGMNDTRKITFEPESGIRKSIVGPNVRKLFNTS